MVKGNDEASRGRILIPSHMEDNLVKEDKISQVSNNIYGAPTTVHLYWVISVRHLASY